jgi:hypothetical protein
LPENETYFYQKKFPPAACAELGLSSDHPGGSAALGSASLVSEIAELPIVSHLGAE